MRRNHYIHTRERERRERVAQLFSLCVVVFVCVDAIEHEGLRERERVPEKRETINIYSRVVGNSIETMQCRSAW